MSTKSKDFSLTHTGLKKITYIQFQAMCFLKQFLVFLLREKGIEEKKR